MQLIEMEPHFWELYQDAEGDYYLGIAVDLSSVVSCWDIVLTAQECADYQHLGRDFLVMLSNQFVAALYRGDATLLENRSATASQKQAMLHAFKAWQVHSNQATGEKK